MVLQFDIHPLFGTTGKVVQLAEKASHQLVAWA